MASQFAPMCKVREFLKRGYMLPKQEKRFCRASGFFAFPRESRELRVSRVHSNKKQLQLVSGVIQMRKTLSDLFLWAGWTLADKASPTETPASMDYREMLPLSERHFYVQPVGFQPSKKRVSA
jgi:hypothetical protein